MKKRPETATKNRGRPSSGLMAQKIANSMQQDPWQSTYKMSSLNCQQVKDSELLSRKGSSYEQINGPVIAKSSAKDIPMSKISNKRSSKKIDSKEEIFSSNVIGQKEEYLDPKDVSKLPPYSKLVVNDKDNFLGTNLKNLISSKGEYYPYITGKCLCSKCSCGSCKCVHFKYKVNENCIAQAGEPAVSRYKEEYKAYPIEKVEMRVAFPELLITPNRSGLPVKKQEDKNNLTAFSFPEEEQHGLNSAKQVNIGPTSVPVTAPFAKETQSKLDYPDWKCAKIQKIEPFKPETVIKNMPFLAKKTNNDYGNFYDEEGTPALQRAVNQRNKKSNIPIDTSIPISYNSAAKTAFPSYSEDQIEPLQRFLPRNNLMCDKTPQAEGHYKKSSDTQHKINKDETCPLNQEIVKLKKNLREFAFQQKIIY